MVTKSRPILRASATVAATAEVVASGTGGAAAVPRAGDESARAVTTGAGASTTAGVDDCGTVVEGGVAVCAEPPPGGAAAPRAEPELELPADDGGAATVDGTVAAGAPCAGEPTVAVGEAVVAAAGAPCFDRHTKPPPTSSTTAAAAPISALDRDDGAAVGAGAALRLGTVGAELAAVTLFETSPVTLGIVGAVITAEPVARCRCE
jgi:hypothetical protein